MHGIITFSTQLVMFAMVAIGTYMFLFAETSDRLAKQADKLAKQEKALGSMKAKIDAIEADQIARQQYVPDFTEEVLDMAQRLDTELDSGKWDDGTRKTINRISADMWDLYADLELESMEG